MEPGLIKEIKKKRNEPYAAIQHRVIDSPAYADLGFPARSLLVLITRQLTKENNGHLSATWTMAKKYGFGSEHTLQKAIAELISHGFIYRTRSHGANKAWARYAVTWLSITRKNELFLHGFVSCSWRYWKKEKDSLKINSGGSMCSIDTAESTFLSVNLHQDLQESAL